MDTTLARPPIGRLLDGRYRVDSRIARGGMATVYLGTDTRLDRMVALKIAHPELANDGDFVRRFIDEARSVARLSSPNVVAVYDQGSDGDILFLAMEYVPGRTLRALLTERGRLSPRESLDLIEGVLTGLAAAHQAGIVHRDVKPENVLITASHAVKVADFGLARAAARASRTKTGMIIGTAAYLAPEQVSHGASDARTDVYATGVMLFELLTGVQPHRGESALEVAHKHVDDAVPAPSSVTPGLPPALDALVALATSRDPELRPADASQFLQAISEVRRGRPIAGVPAAGPRGRPCRIARGRRPGAAGCGATRRGAARRDHRAGRLMAGSPGLARRIIVARRPGPGRRMARQHDPGRRVIMADRVRRVIVAGPARLARRVIMAGPARLARRLIMAGLPGAAHRVIMARRLSPGRRVIMARSPGPGQPIILARRHVSGRCLIMAGLPGAACRVIMARRHVPGRRVGSPGPGRRIITGRSVRSAGRAVAARRIVITRRGTTARRLSRPRRTAAREARARPGH